LKAHHVLHDPVKPLRIADKKVRRSEAIREVAEDRQYGAKPPVHGRRACCTSIDSEQLHHFVCLQ
jgi:hypothetical protein